MHLPPVRDGDGDPDFERGAEEGGDHQLKVIGDTHSQAREIKVIKFRNPFIINSLWPWLFDAGRLGKVIFLKPELISEKFVTVTLQKLQFLLLIFQRKFYCFSCS